MILLAAALFAIGLAVALATFRGGDVRNMASLRLRHGWLAWVAIGVQTALVTWSFPDAASRVIHLGTYAAAGAFAIANRRIAGVYLISVGGFLNLVAILANGGVMPASKWALDASGLGAETEFSNSNHVAGARLQFLGDIFPVPADWPLSNVFSIGDVIIVIGVGYLVYRGSRLRDRQCAGSREFRGGRSAASGDSAVRRHATSDDGPSRSSTVAAELG